MRDATYFRNGRQVSEEIAKRDALTGYHVHGYMDMEEFEEMWQAAKRDTFAGECARDSIFEWSGYQLEIEI